MPALSLYSAGSNARGQLATDDIDDAHTFTACTFLDSPPGQLPPHIVAVKQIACGANHTLALLARADGGTELWGCGDGRKGQLGPSYALEVDKAGSASLGAVFRPISLQAAETEGYSVRLVAAGWETSYVVLSSPGQSDRLFSMGANDFGALGVGVAPPSSSAVHAIPLELLVAATSTTDVTLTILALVTGPHHAVVQVRLARRDGSSCTLLAGWGAARHGQLGSVPSPDSRTRAQPFLSSPHPIPLPTPEDVRALALGTQHTVLLSAAGTPVALGSDRKGQLGGLAGLRNVSAVACTWNGTYVLLDKGQVLATGSDTHSQLGRGSNAESGENKSTGLDAVRFPKILALGNEQAKGKVEKLVCGSEHVLCILAVGEEKTREVWGWGWNEHGNLGTGKTEDVDIPVRLWPSGGTEEAESTVVDVWAGCGTSWILVRR